MYIEKLKARFAELQHLFPYKLLPCREEQIHSLERRYGLTLPMDYKEFLLWGGIGAGVFFKGSNCFYDYLSELREGAEELLERDEFPEPLPKDAFVFLMKVMYFGFSQLPRATTCPLTVIRRVGQESHTLQFLSKNSLLASVNF